MPPDPPQDDRLAGLLQEIDRTLKDNRAFLEGLRQSSGGDDDATLASPAPAAPDDNDDEEAFEEL